MEATMLNAAQLQILDMMSFVKSEDTLQELKQLISDYFAQKAQAEIDRLWEIGELNEEKVESFRHLHAVRKIMCIFATREPAKPPHSA